MGFADIGLAYQFAVSLGALIALIFLVAMVRLYLKKRELAQHQMRRDLEAAENVTKKVVMQERLLEEGDYFGVRAIEQGYYGGVAQSPPVSGNNSPRLSPVPAIIGRIGSPVLTISSQGSSISEFSLNGRARSRAPSGVRSLNTEASTRSPRLQPSDAELSGRRNHDPTITVNSFAHVPPSPIFPSRLEASEESTPDCESVSVTATPPRMRPTLNRQVQSYAQWRLSADLRSTARVKNRVSCTRSRDISDNNAYTNLQTGRRRSRSVSTAELVNQLRSLQQEVDAMKAAGSFDSVTKASSSVANSTDGTVRQPSRRRTRSQPAACSHRPYLKGSTRSIKQTRDLLRRAQKLSAKPGALKRRSRQRTIMTQDPSISYLSHNDSAVGQIFEFENPLGLLSGGRAYEERYGSRSSLISGSIKRSGSSSSASSASSIKSATDEASTDPCQACRQDSENGLAGPAPNQPATTLQIS